MGKLAIVTGAAGSIGSAICKRLLADGYRVAGLDRAPQGADGAAIQAPAYMHLLADVTVPGDVEAAVAAAIAAFGIPIVLVNNAGGAGEATLKSMTDRSWTEELDLNLNAAWRCMHAVTAPMKSSRHGLIVNIASVNGLAVYGYPAYSAAKAGLVQLTRFAAVELGPHGIRTNAVCPGTVRTAAWTRHLAGNPDLFERIRRRYPLGDVCEPEDVANLVAFIVSPQARMLNGAVIPLDGGISAGSLEFAREFLDAGDA